MDEQARQEQLQWSIDKLTVTTEQVEQKLAEQIKSMQATIEQLNSITNASQNELAEITKQYEAMQQPQLQRPAIVEQWVTTLNQRVETFNPQQDWPWIAGGFILLALLITWFWLMRKPKLVKLATDEIDEEDNEDEYDFLGSEEGIPAKLDLARAYIAMEDIPAAKTVLQEVVAQGNHEQRQQARTLLNELPS